MRKSISFVLFWLLIFSLSGFAAHGQIVTIGKKKAVASPIALINNAGNVASDGTTATTSGINTAGANFLVCAVTWYELGGPPTVSDEIGGSASGNTWTTLTTYSVGFTSASIRLAYVANANVSSSANHTFKATGSSTYPGVGCAAFSNVKTSSPLDSGSDNGNSGSATTLQIAGAETPSVDGALVITAGTTGGGGAGPTVDSPFHPALISIATNPGGGEAVGFAFEIQTTATSRQPTWTFPGTDDAGVALAIFLQQ